jgi:hypothetical protein
MSDEITIPIAALGGGTGLVGLLTVIGGYLFRSHDARLKAIEEDNKANAAAARLVATDLSEFELEAEKRFAKEETMQASLGRIHDRIDLLATKDDVKELRDDIKKLMGKTGVA